MPFRLLPSRLLLAAAVLALPLTGGGCGRRACFTWSTQEGSCPAQSEALQFFSTPRCPGQITSVESAPTHELDGTLCCYEVTADEKAIEPGCQGFGGANSTGREESVSFAAATSGGQGGAGGDPTCARCAEAIDNFAGVSICTDTTAHLLDALLTCACSTTCADPCIDSFCSSASPSPECTVCLLDTSLGCGNEFDACLNDL